MHDVNVIGGEECVSQHKKLSHPEVPLEYENCVIKVHNPFKTHRILTLPGPESKPVCLMLVILCLVGHGMVNQNVKKFGGEMMKLTPSSKKKDDFGKSGRRVEIKKSIFKQKGRQRELYMLQGKEHKKTNLVILNAMINVIKSLRKLVE